MSYHHYISDGHSTGVLTNIKLPLRVVIPLRRVIPHKKIGFEEQMKSFLNVIVNTMRIFLLT